MKLNQWAICALILVSTAGVALAQNGSPCPRLPRPAGRGGPGGPGGPGGGGQNADLNKSTVLPTNSPSSVFLIPIVKISIGRRRRLGAYTALTAPSPSTLTARRSGSSIVAA